MGSAYFPYSLMTILKAIAPSLLQPKAFNYRYYGAIAFTLYIASSTAQLRELYLSKRNL
ncbi:MAG TPA: hypothetical protein VE944_11860 [Nostoc sp.]|uniref:hypothetical protein n=1 Tax=Nostoc sp. TaxID=1180 RepID=UPI002D43754A|nr:hypothetical protein [Nostoc sp.]HYX15037.1 hypothetical protein [Nostoc sp.]